MKKEFRYKIIFVIIMVACFALFLYWGFRKEGYHVDEMYMYGTANSEYLPFMHMGVQEYSVKDWMKEYGAGENPVDLFRNLSKDISILKANGWDIKGSEIYSAYSRARECSNDIYTTTWMSGQAYRDYIAVSPDNRFNYISVLYNFRGDNHPPLYALLLHTICSLFPGVYSKWFGLGLNMVIGLLAIALLYRTVERFFGGKDTALMAAALYGLSAAAAITASYIRMYSLVTLMVIGMAYAHLNLASKGWEWDKKDKRLLVFFTLGGYLSQYYFVIYAFAIAMVSVFVMLFRKKFSALFRYILTMCITGAAGIALWPFSLKAVFKGSRGAESIGGFFSLEGTLDRLKAMLYVLVHNTLGIPEWLFLGIAVFLTATGLILLVFRKRYGDRYRIEKTMMVAVPFAVYFVAVSKMIPYLVDRYIMCIMPWCGMLVVCGVRFCIRRLTDKEKAQWILSAVCYLPLLLCSNSLIVGNCEVYAGRQECDSIAEGTDCVYILPDGWWNESAEDTLLLSKCRDTAVVFEGSADVLAGTYDAAVGSDLLMVVHRGVEAGDNVAAIAAALTPADTVLEEASRESVRSNTWIHYKVKERSTDAAGRNGAYGSDAYGTAGDAGNGAGADGAGNGYGAGGADGDGENVGILKTAEDIALTDTDGRGRNYRFVYGDEGFKAEFNKDTWKIVDSYRIINSDDMMIICEALLKEHPVYIGDSEEMRTPADMALEWTEHNMAYALLPDGSEWLSHAKDVDLDPYDVGKSFFEIYEDRTGKKFNPGDFL
ncbi:MAG: hypothetical protein IJM34_13475 [Lachnospiraceae bacterium]|nr:hypothetical protein [Lachnospiraceae bacterium]